MKSEKYKVYSYDGHENEQVVASFDTLAEAQAGSIPAPSTKLSPRMRSAGLEANRNAVGENEAGGSDMEKILVDFGGSMTHCEQVQKLDESTAVVRWHQPQVGDVTGAVEALGDTHPETGETVWTWNGDYELVE